MTHPERGIQRRRVLAASVCLASGAAALSARTVLAAEASPAAEAVPVVANAVANAGANAATSLPRPVPALAQRSIDGLGVELMAIRLAASDFLIDFRYRVKDVAKAQPLLEMKMQPVLVNEATGDRYYVPKAPKVGSLKQSATAKQPAIVDRVYFMLFANPDRKLKSGEKVTLYAGESVVKDIVVQ
jgi:hypothetical protein